MKGCGARRAASSAAVALALATGCAGEEHIRLLEPAGQTSTSDAAASGASIDAGASRDASPERTIDSLRRAACGRWTTQRQPDQALLMVVVDVSGSMALPTVDGRSRWDVERPILANAVATLPGSVGVGALYYPNMVTTPGSSPRPPSACVNVDAAIPLGLLGAQDSRQRALLQRSLGMTEPKDQAGTPTLDAYLLGLDALGRTTLGGRRQMLLITDGQPTFAEGCVGTGQMDIPVDYTPIVDAVRAARRAGVDTFVIGSPGSEQSIAGGDARPWLSRAAEAGGTAPPGCSHSGPRYCHFDMVSEPDFGKGLQAALAAISSRIARCDFALPRPPPNDLVDMNSLNIVLTSGDGTETLLPDEAPPACSSGSGFVFSSDRQRVSLCDDTCALVRGTPGARLEFLFGCQGG